MNIQRVRLWCSRSPSPPRKGKEGRQKERPPHQKRPGVGDIHWLSTQLAHFRLVDNPTDKPCNVCDKEERKTVKGNKVVRWRPSGKDHENPPYTTGVVCAPRKLSHFSHYSIQTSLSGLRISSAWYLRRTSRASELSPTQSGDPVPLMNPGAQYCTCHLLKR